MSESGAMRTVERTVPADATMSQRLYVRAPAGTRAQDLAFTLSSLEADGESDRVELTFSAPEN